MVDRRLGLGSAIRELRESKEMTQDELAERVGTTRAYISQIETGNKRWPKKYIPALARELGVSEIALAREAGKLSPENSMTFALSGVSKAERQRLIDAAREISRSQGHRAEAASAQPAIKALREGKLRGLLDKIIAGDIEGVSDEDIVNAIIYVLLWAPDETMDEIAEITDIRGEPVLTDAQEARRRVQARRKSAQR